MQYVLDTTRIHVIAVFNMAQIEDVCTLGGADTPYELILEYVGGRVPGGAPGTPEQSIWLRMRSWMLVSRRWLVAWRQYQRELWGPRKSIMHAIALHHPTATLDAYKPNKTIYIEIDTYVYPCTYIQIEVSWGIIQGLAQIWLGVSTPLSTWLVATKITSATVWIWRMSNRINLVPYTIPPLLFIRDLLYNPIAHNRKTEL